MGNKRIIISKCRIIFFDLEFYVPQNSRSNIDFCYNPWDKDSKLLGGSFLIANPQKDFGITEYDIRKRTKSLWIWNHESEKDLLLQIYNTLKNTYDMVRNAHDGAVSPILCGIGITSSDIPILFELFKRYKILTNSEAFSFQNGFRVIDLSQLSVATFNNSNNFLYPKTNSHILNKYLPDIKFESGKSVWQLYESGDYEGIQSRVLSEVATTHRCYESIKSDLDQFKYLERDYQKYKKLKRKMEQKLDSLRKED